MTRPHSRIDTNRKQESPHMRTTFNVIRYIGLAVAFAALAACATSGGGGGASKRASGGDAVEERAVARWNLLIAGDFDHAYDYLSPGARSAKTRERYAAEHTGQPVRWQTVKFVAKECASEDSCKVLVEIEYEISMSSPGVGKVKVPAPLEEQWVRLKGAWYYVPQEVVQGGLR
jgi:hypothetical protein